MISTLLSFLGSFLDYQYVNQGRVILCQERAASMYMQAVREMPSGQGGPMIAFIAQHTPSLAALPAESPAQAAFGEVLASCLASIRVEVVAAPTLADAAADLLTTSLRPVLEPILSTVENQYANSPEPPSAALTDAAMLTDADQALQHHVVLDLNFSAGHAKQAQQAQHAAAAVGKEVVSDTVASVQLLRCLLRLYHGAVDLHNRCAGTQLQVQPLPGQGTGLTTHQLPYEHVTGESLSTFQSCLELFLGCTLKISKLK